MKRELVTIAPAIDAFTSMYCPVESAARAMINSVKFPSVAFNTRRLCHRSFRRRIRSHD